MENIKIIFTLSWVIVGLAMYFKKNRTAFISTLSGFGWACVICFGYLIFSGNGLLLIKKIHILQKPDAIIKSDAALALGCKDRTDVDGIARYAIQKDYDLMTKEVLKLTIAGRCTPFTPGEKILITDIAKSDVQG